MTKTDARGVVVTNTYDALNRPTQRSYVLTANVGVTSTANYSYDGTGLTGVTPNFAKGKLKSVDGMGDIKAVGREIQEVIEGLD